MECPSSHGASGECKSMAAGWLDGVLLPLLSTLQERPNDHEWIILDLQRRKSPCIPSISLGEDPMDPSTFAVAAAS